MGPKMIQFILKNKSSLTPMKNSSFIVANFLDIPRLFKIMILLSLLKTSLQLHFFVVINSVKIKISKRCSILLFTLYNEGNLQTIKPSKGRTEIRELTVLMFENILESLF